MLKPETVNKIVDLVLDAYLIAKDRIEEDSPFYTKKVQDLLEEADACIYHETKPRFVSTDGGLQLLVSSTGDFNDIHPPTRESIVGWLRAQHLA